MWGEILMKHTAIRIPEEIIEELRRIAVQNERSLSGEIRLALRQYLRGCTGQCRKKGAQEEHRCASA
jgi:predicted transcriptional regulator